MDARTFRSPAAGRRTGFVRPYAVTRGRTRPTGQTPIDPLCLVVTVRRPPPGPMSTAAADPEYSELLHRCSTRRMTVARLTADSGLSFGVLRVLLDDLRSAGLIRVLRPAPCAELPDVPLLRAVLKGLEAL
ncbi:DUF742 domain-containing protein [Streptomyces mauvecolor]|uniref:DUF742 domain-containing protein n=1 Tax=Streptomyces sp. HUAS TT7 TaxID=3447507 RepID=UPI003F6578C2